MLPKKQNFRYFLLTNRLISHPKDEQLGSEGGFLA